MTVVNVGGEPDPGAGGHGLGVLVAVAAQLGVLGKLAAVLEEERARAGVVAVEVPPPSMRSTRRSAACMSTKAHCQLEQQPHLDQVPQLTIGAPDVLHEPSLCYEAELSV